MHFELSNWMIDKTLYIRNRRIILSLSFMIAAFRRFDNNPITSTNNNN